MRAADGFSAKSNLVSDAFTTLERYGHLWVAMDAPRYALPDIPEFDDPTYRTIFQFYETWATSGLRFIVTTNRNQYTMFSQFELLGVDITAADVVVVKIGYLEPDLYDTQKGWLMALTPGGVDQDLIRLGHHKIERPMYPFDPDMDEPDLHAQVVVP